MGGTIGRQNINDAHFNMFRVHGHTGEHDSVSLIIEIKSSELVLHCKGRSPLCWPLDSIRKYGFEPDSEQFYFESGRRGPEGPRIYVFKCSRSRKLFNTLKDTVKRYRELNQTRMAALDISMSNQRFGTLPDNRSSDLMISSMTTTLSDNMFPGFGGTLPPPQRQYVNLERPSSRLTRTQSLNSRLHHRIVPVNQREYENTNLPAQPWTALTESASSHYNYPRPHAESTVPNSHLAESHAESTVPSSHLAESLASSHGSSSLAAHEYENTNLPAQHWTGQSDSASSHYSYPRSHAESIVPNSHVAESLASSDGSSSHDQTADSVSFGEESLTYLDLKLPSPTGTPTSVRRGASSPEPHAYSEIDFHKTERITRHLYRSPIHD